MNEIISMETKGFYEISQFYRTQVQILASRSLREDVLARYKALGRDDGDDDLDKDGKGVQRLQGMITIVPAEQSQLIHLTVMDTDPERAALIANLLADAYRDRNLTVRQDAARAAKVWLEGKIVEYRKDIEKSNAALLEFKAERQIVDVEEQISSMSARMVSLNKTYADVQTERVVAET